MLDHALHANDFDEEWDGQNIMLHSSNLCCTRYHSDLKELDVHFVNGTSYTYLDVPRHVVQRLLLANSAGHYFTRRIRQRYVYVKNEEGYERDHE